VKELKATLQKRVNLLKYIASIKWGGHPKILSILFKNFIRSNINYGSTIYANAPKTILQKLETIQNTGKRLSNHGNGKPRTQEGLDGENKGLKEHLQH
jgi:hypothetical protein